MEIEEARERAKTVADGLEHWTPEMLERLHRQAAENAESEERGWERRIETARQRVAEDMGKLRDALARDAWGEVFPGIGMPPVEWVRLVKQRAERMRDDLIETCRERNRFNEDLEAVGEALRNR